MDKQERRSAAGIALALAALAFGSTGAQAQSWTNWTSMTPGYPVGSATGTITLGSSSVNVSYVGEVQGGSTTNPVPYWSFPGTYTSATAPNDPGATGFIQLIGPSVGNTISFSSPVQDVFIAVMSLGQGGVPVSYQFNMPFTLLSQGAGTYGGCGSCLAQTAPNILAGQEGDGVIEFSGPISTLSFDIVGSEDFHGITIGVDQLATTTTPEPATVALVGSGLLAIIPLARRRKRS